MSKRAVEDLLTYWDESSNPILRSAAGQMRQAIREEAPGFTCERCERRGVSRFVETDTGHECWNADACDRRVAAL